MNASTRSIQQTRSSIPSKALLTALMLCFTDAHTTERSLQDQLLLAQTLCAKPNQLPHQLANHRFTERDIVVRGSTIGIEKSFATAEYSTKLEIIDTNGRPRRVVMTTALVTDNTSLPATRLTLGNECELILAHRITYRDNTALYIETLSSSLEPLPHKEWLNPPLPASAGKPDGLKVAMIDSGVNYTLADISNALALDNKGTPIGYDFWDNDDTPYDANPARSQFHVQRHGTRTASLLIKEAPGIALVPYRYPRPDMSRMTQLVEHAAAHSIRIIGMPLGSNRYKDWLAFSDAAAAHPNILFIVSAGNNGRDIDDRAVYPASLEHNNILVVTSSDDYIRPAERTNYGKISVDYLVPAESIMATDYSGAQTLVSGSSYAVSRMTALASRLLALTPDMPIEHLKTRIAALSVKANTSRYVSTGYLGDPLADTSLLQSHIDHSYQPAASSAEHTLRVNLIALDRRWTTDRIDRAISQLGTLYKACGIGLTTMPLIRVTGASYIANLSPGNALTLHRHLQPLLTPQAATIYFANDTDMQVKFDAEAFGIANTENRPWMRNSVWLSENTQDVSIALAHELIHVLVNNGQHSPLANNLMRDQTAPENTQLTPEQCSKSVDAATINGLLTRATR